MPLLILTPFYLRLERRTPAGASGSRCCSPSCLIVELATLSRSGMLGLVVGAVVLLVSRTGTCCSRGWLLLPLGARRRAGRARGLPAAATSSSSCCSSRLDDGTAVERAPRRLRLHPARSCTCTRSSASGFNNFSVYYEFVTGKTNWGPHSFYVALLVETGLVGTALFAIFLWYLFPRLRRCAAARAGAGAAGDPLAARVRPLAWGLTAALLGTMAANVFYLTMSFYYFYVFAHARRSAGAARLRPRARGS